MSGVFQLVYCSSAVRPMDEAALTSLLLRARANNTRLGITGVLLYHDGSFLQVLEGAEAVVRSLFDRIVRDPAHSSVVELLSRPIEQREFPGWSMGFVGGSAAVSLVPGFRTFFDGTSSSGERRSAVAEILSAFRAGRFRKRVST